MAPPPHKKKKKKKNPKKGSLSTLSNQKESQALAHVIMPFTIHVLLKTRSYFVSDPPSQTRLSIVNTEDEQSFCFFLFLFSSNKTHRCEIKVQAKHIKYDYFYQVWLILVYYISIIFLDINFDIL